MKIAAFLGTVLLTSALCVTALAAAAAPPAPPAPMDKYQDMLANSNELKQADKAIKDSLAEARKILTKEDFQKLETLQSSWVKNEFNANVKAYMKEGMNEAEAWAMEIGSHADNISRAVEIFRLRREGKGEEGVYEFTKGVGDKRLHGILLVKKVDASYTVSIEVTSGKAGAINVSDAAVCTFSGEGTIKDKVLTATVEDSPETLVNIVFAGKIARVTANPGADEQCGKDMTLSGSYSK